MSVYCPINDSDTVYLDCQECEDKWCECFFCLIVGSRGFTDYKKMEEITNYLLKNKKNIVIVSGGAKGADFLAKKYALEHHLLYKEFPADWDKYGKRAGYIRNEEMHKYLSKQKQKGVIAFWDGQSKGTSHNFDLAKKYKNNIKIIKI